MRVIAGEFKGRGLVTPRGHRTRPTADQVRTALMDALTPRLPGARVLDLFAGSGGVGVEALSRGAAHATFVERDPQAVRAIAQNIAALGLRARARLLRSAVSRGLEVLAREGARFDVVFLDPPYDDDVVADATLEELGEGGVLDAGAIVVTQHLTKRPPRAPRGLEATRTRRFGETTLTFLRARE